MPRSVVLVIFDAVELLDVSGPLAVFAGATRLLGRPDAGYRVTLVAPRRGPVATSSGARLLAERGLAGLRGPIDTLLVAGGPDIAGSATPAALVEGVRRAARRARRIASVCTGAFVLARAGLLAGRRATTHWAACAALRRQFPGCAVEDDPIYVHDRGVWTSAGVSAGIDLALALVEADHGRALALSVARWLVVYLRRPGGQSQFSASLSHQTAEHEPLRELQMWISEHLAADLGVDALARRAGMSVRNFARVFRREVGATPRAYVEALRLEAARRALESSAQPIKRIARDCGFGTPETMHRAFQRLLQVTPADYRRSFAGERRAPRRR